LKTTRARKNRTKSVVLIYTATYACLWQNFKCFQLYAIGVDMQTQSTKYFYTEKLFHFIPFATDDLICGRRFFATIAKTKILVAKKVGGRA